MQCGLVLGALAATMGASPAFAQFSGYYSIIARHSGKAVVVQNASTAENAAVVQFPYSSGGSTNDEWSIVSVTTGYYRVMARHSGKALAVSGASTASSAVLVQATYSAGGSSNDEWAVEDLGTGYFRFVNRNSGKVMDVKQGSTADNAVIQQSTSSGVNQQQYQLVPVAVTVTPTPTPTPTTGTGPTATPTPTPTQPSNGGWTLKWTADPSRGMATWEGVEDDRAHSHTSFGPHIRAEGDLFKWYMHLVDRDGSDRQRHEVKGMNENGTDIKILQGQKWKFVYEMFMPTTLTGGSKFTHIHQMKMVSDAGSSGTPLSTLSTSISGSTETLVMRSLNGGTNFNPIPLAPLRGHWIEVELEYGIGFGGYARMCVRDGGVTVTDKTMTGVDMWINEGTSGRYARPKWGIYRSLESSGLKDTFLQIRNLRAYQK
jgi:chitin-binding protein